MVAVVFQINVKNHSNLFVTTKFLSIFVVHYLIKVISMRYSEYSEKELDLLEAIRNYRKSLHNKSSVLEEYAHELFNELMYDEE